MDSVPAQTIKDVLLILFFLLSAGLGIYAVLPRRQRLEQPVEVSAAPTHVTTVEFEATQGAVEQRLATIEERQIAYEGRMTQDIQRIHQRLDELKSSSSDLPMQIVSLLRNAKEL